MSQRQFSILLPTYNTLPYLKVCLNSIERNSGGKHQVCVHDDGSLDGTWDYLNGVVDAFGFELSISHSSWKGMPYSFNCCVDLAENDYVFLGNADTYFGPQWDVNLSEWLALLDKDAIISTLWVEPTIGGSYLYYNCGLDADSFDENKFCTYAESVTDDELVPWGEPGALTMLLPRWAWCAANGMDVAFSPKSCADIDFAMRLVDLDLCFALARNVLLYHFQRKSKLSMPDNNAHLFEKKWGLSVGDGHERVKAQTRRMFCQNRGGEASDPLSY